MENIGIDTLKQDRDYFGEKLSKAQVDYQNIQNLIIHLEGILTYNEQLINFLNEQNKEEEIKEE